MAWGKQRRARETELGPRIKAHESSRQTHEGRRGLPGRPYAVQRKEREKRVHGAAQRTD